MNWKFSANAAFFGLQRNRFTQYQPDRTLEEKFALAAQVEGLEGIDVNLCVSSALSVFLLRVWRKKS